LAIASSPNKAVRDTALKVLKVRNQKSEDVIAAAKATGDVMAVNREHNK
jgi:hypothetical protein